MAIYQGEQIVTQGAPGKTAYQSAVEAGYTGTEEEFNAALANVGEEAKIITSATEPNLNTGDQWHKEI